MRPVICFGEALIDFLNVGKNESAGLILDDYRQYPGGAPANVAVAIALLGGDARFAGQIGSDVFGDFLQNALEYYGVDNRFLLRHPTAKTALAFVTLDNDGDRRFSFHRDKTADVIVKPEQVSDSWFTENGLFHFCSNSLTDASISETTLHAIKLARSADNLVSFDVNLRHSLWLGGQVNADLVNKFIELSDVIKFSREEIEFLSQNQPVECFIKRCLQAGPELIVITDGGNPIEYYHGKNKYLLNPPVVRVADTTAGGDAFSGGLLFGLSSLVNPLNAIHNALLLQQLIGFAAACGGVAVSNLGAFPSLPDLSDVSEAWCKFNEHSKV